MLNKPFSSIKSISKQYFSAYFGHKPSMEKILIFDQNHGLTPLQKFQFFFTFLKRNFNVKESLLFYLEYQQTIFCRLILPKNKVWKTFQFLIKTVDFANTRIFDTFLKIIFICKGKPSFLSRISANNISRPILPKNKLWKKFQFLTKTMD